MAGCCPGGQEYRPAIVSMAEQNHLQRSRWIPSPEMGFTLLTENAYPNRGPQTAKKSTTSKVSGLETDFDRRLSDILSSTKEQRGPTVAVN